MSAVKFNITIIVSIIACTWCSNTSGNLPNGKDIDSIVCLEIPEQTYSLYIPTGPTDRTPLIVFLEPGGRGKLPVELYSGLAEQYGIILACSYNGRNGPPELYKNGLDAMIPDLIRRFSPDTSRMILCGFSGGARYAAVYSHTNLNAGVIACGAGMSPLAGPEQLDLPFYTGIAGRSDMNYLEVIETVDKAWQSGTPAWMIPYDGEHDWPDTIAFRRALDQALLQWHVKGLRPQDSLELDRIRTGMYLHIDSLLSKNRHCEARMMKERFKEHPLFEATDLDWMELAGKFPAGREGKRDLRLCRRIIQEEERFQDSILVALKGINLALYKQMQQLKPPDWWKNHGRQVKRKMESDQSLYRESAIRMYEFTMQNFLDWGYIYLVDLNEPEHAILYIEACCSFDMKNSQAYYWLALAYAKADLEQEALGALDTAVENGLSDVSRVENTSYFDNLRSYDEYSAIIQKMKNKYLLLQPE